MDADEDDEEEDDENLCHLFGGASSLEEEHTNPGGLPALSESDSPLAIWFMISALSVTALVSPFLLRHAGWHH